MRVQPKLERGLLGLLLGGGLFGHIFADSLPPSRPWEPDAFRPVTEARIATLAAYAAWQAMLPAK